ncbi:GyrI-like domain-containing protein [Pseudorhodoplanes sp.]|uniref:GyrI-like domain-containing protein n=1 Tax=Pseudorhodoplanes sp. TaxID=1934341 RepID=UPI003D127C94
MLPARLMAVVALLALAIHPGLAATNSAQDDAFGQEITLPEKTIIYLQGTGTWDTAYETLVEAFRTVHEYIDKRGLKPDGEAMMIYTGADDTGFDYRAAVPVMGPFDNPPKGDMAVGTSPTGKAYKFVHRGAYDGMENLYEAITNFFDEKNLEPGDLFIERYVTDPRTTSEDELVIEVIFPVRNGAPVEAPKAPEPLPAPPETGSRPQ